ncbi:MAG: hypothetical protein KF716_20325 [Anaerolineae bacterium]|nr:hypothetical protein [Anaerolineae bacterium]
MLDPQPSVQGIRTETTDDGIFIIRADNARRESVDALCVLLHNFDLEGLALSRHNRSMLVLSSHVYPTPYATQRLIALARTTPPQLLESHAVIVTDSVVARLVRMLIGKLDNKARQVTNIFLNEQDGLQWLRERARIIAEYLGEQDNG